MSEDFLTQIKSEGEPAFQIEETDTPTDSSPESNETEETQSSEGDNTQDVQPEKVDEPVKQVPFHEDPKVQEYIQRQLEKRQEEYDAKFRELEEKVKPPQPKVADTIPAWFGGDEESWNLYKADQDRLIEQAEERALKRINETKSAEEQRIAAANKHFEDSIQEIESQGVTVDRNKLLKAAIDNELIDSQGRWNYKAAYKLVAAEEKATVDPAKLNAKKNLAASTTSESKAEKPARDYVTSEDLRGMGWASIK